MGLEPKEEKRIPEGYSIDITVEWGGETIAIEVDGPSHFMGGGRQVTGSTALKRRQLRRLGWKARAGCCCGGHSLWCEHLLWRQVLSVPFWEWEEQNFAADPAEQLRRQFVYLSLKLDEAADVRTIAGGDGWVVIDCAADDDAACTPPGEGAPEDGGTVCVTDADAPDAWDLPPPEVNR